MRPIEQLKKSPKGTWYIDVEVAKTPDSIRFVPISDIVLKAGFIEWVEKNKAAGATYLFPDQDHNDPDSRNFSREFGNTIESWLYALHMARIFGRPYQLLVCLFGLATAMLSVTGVYIWWTKRKPRVQRQTARPSVKLAVRALVDHLKTIASRR